MTSDPLSTSRTLSQMFNQMTNTLFLSSQHHPSSMDPIKKLSATSNGSSCSGGGWKQFENGIATIPSRSYSIIFVVLESIVSNCPILSKGKKQELVSKLEACHTQPNSVSGLLLTVVFLSIVVATVTYSTGVGFDFTLLLLIAGLWMVTSRYAGRLSKKTPTVVVPSPSLLSINSDDADASLCNSFPSDSRQPWSGITTTSTQLSTDSLPDGCGYEHLLSPNSDEVTSTPSSLFNTLVVEDDDDDDKNLHVQQHSSFQNNNDNNHNNALMVMVPQNLEMFSDASPSSLALSEELDSNAAGTTRFLMVAAAHEQNDSLSLSPSSPVTTSTTSLSIAEAFNNASNVVYHPIDPALLYRNRFHTVETLFPLPSSTESLCGSAISSSRSDRFVHDYSHQQQIAAAERPSVNALTLYASDGSSEASSFDEVVKVSMTEPFPFNQQQHHSKDLKDGHAGTDDDQQSIEDGTTQPTTPIKLEELIDHIEDLQGTSSYYHYEEHETPATVRFDTLSHQSRQQQQQQHLQPTPASSYQLSPSTSYWDASSNEHHHNNNKNPTNTDSMLWLLDSIVDFDASKDIHQNIDDNNTNANDTTTMTEDTYHLIPQLPLPSMCMLDPIERVVDFPNLVDSEDVLAINGSSSSCTTSDVVNSLMEEPEKSDNHPSILRGLCDTALNSFIEGGEAAVLQPDELRSLFMMLAKNLRATLKAETAIPFSHDSIDFDPLYCTPSESDLWTGDAVQFKSLIEDRNALWNWIDHVYHLLVSSGLVNPKQTWSHHLTTRPPNEKVKALLDVDLLNELMSATLELLDSGLQTIDLWMQPAIEKTKENHTDDSNHGLLLVSLADDPLAYVDDELHHALKEETELKNGHQSLSIDGTTDDCNEEDQQNTPIFHSCSQLNLKLALQTLHQLQVLFFSTVRYQKKDPKKSDMRKFIELLIRSHLLIGSEEAVVIARELLETRLEALSVGAVGRCLRTSIRSPIARQFWDIVEELYRLPTDRAESNEEYYDTVRGLRDSLWPILIDCRVQYKMFNEALQLLDTYSKSGGLMPQHFSSAVIQLGLECERIDLIHTEMERGRPLNDIHQYMQVVRVLGRNGDVSGALKVLEQLENDDLVKPDVPAYNSVLDVCVSNSDLHAAETLFRHMKTLCMLDVVSFNIMIKGHIRVKPPDLTTACTLLQMMRSLNFTPDGVSYNSIIGAAVATDRMDLAWNLIDDMEKSGVSVDRYTCSIMIKHLRPSSSPRDRKRTLDLMEKIDVCEDTILFSTIVDACARLKDQRRLRQALEKFHQSGLRPNVHAYGTLIKAYGRCRDVNRAWSLWKEMTETRRLDPTNYTYGCMFDTLVSNGRVEEGISLLNNSLRKGREANTVQYSILIKGCAQKKQVDEALALYHDMQVRQVPCNEVTYNTLINACASAGDLTRAEMIMSNMKDSSNCKPDVITYSTMIKGFCSQGQADRAFELFNEMESENIQPDAIVFNTLLEGCSKRMQVDTAEEVFQKMLDRQVSPSSFTLTILIKLYGKTNNLDKALTLADELPRQFGFEADAYVYTALVAGCLTNGEVNKALEYFRSMNVGDTRGAVSGRTFGTVIIGCMKSCRYFTAYELLAEAHSRNLDVDPAVIQRLQQNFVGRKEELAGLCPVPISHHISQIARWLSARVSRRSKLDPPPQLPQSIRDIMNDIEREFRYDGYMPSFHTQRNYNSNQYQHQPRPSDSQRSNNNFTQPQSRPTTSNRNGRENNYHGHNGGDHFNNDYYKNHNYQHYNSNSCNTNTKQQDVHQTHSERYIPQLNVNDHSNNQQNCHNSSLQRMSQTSQSPRQYSSHNNNNNHHVPSPSMLMSSSTQMLIPPPPPNGHEDYNNTVTSHQYHPQYHLYQQRQPSPNNHISHDRIMSMNNVDRGNSSPSRSSFVRDDSHNRNQPQRQQQQPSLYHYTNAQSRRSTPSPNSSSAASCYSLPHGFN